MCRGAPTAVCVLARACRRLPRNSGPSTTWSSRSGRTPVPGPGQVVVDVKAMGVNFVDGLICQGRYQMKPAAPYVPGGELAGVVSAVADDVSRVEVGDRVMAMNGFGAFAEQVAVDSRSVELIPADLGFGQAAAFIQSYSTAWFTMTRRTAVAEGEWVLVLGAGGGIGLAAVDVGRGPRGQGDRRRLLGPRSWRPPGPWGRPPPSPTRTRT